MSISMTCSKMKNEPTSLKSVKQNLKEFFNRGYYGGIIGQSGRTIKKGYLIYAGIVMLLFSFKMIIEGEVRIIYTYF